MAEPVYTVSLVEPLGERGITWQVTVGQQVAAMYLEDGFVRCKTFDGGLDWGIPLARCKSVTMDVRADG